MRMLLQIFIQIIIVPAAVCGGVGKHGKMDFKMLYEACPYTTFCQANASMTFEEDTRKYMPCCPPCSCDENCLQSHNCCPDKVVDDQRDRIVSERDGDVSMVCKAAVVKDRPGDHEYNGYMDGIARYRIYDQCPTTEVNQTLSAKCNGGEKAAFMDYVWVSDKVSGKIYQNRYCAQCHGVTNFVEWKLRAKCALWLLTGYISDYRDTVLSTDLCRLSNEAPATEYAVTDKYRCFETTVESCPKTHTMNENRKMCENGFTYEFVQPAFPDVYNNMFCYMCFEEKETGEILSVCPRTRDVSRSNFKQFSVLVNWNHKEEQRQMIDSQCDIDEVFDKFKAICRPLKCPFGTEPYFGQCKQFLTQSDGIAIQVHYNLEILWNSSNLTVEDLNAYNETSLGLKVFAQVQQLIGSSKRVCYPCSVYVLKDSDDIAETSKIQYHFLASTNTACQLGDLYERLINVLNKEFTINTEGSQFLTLRVTLDKRANDEVTSTMHKVIYYEKKQTCLPAYIVKDENYCPEIELQYIVIESLVKTGRMAKTFEYEAEAMHENKTIDVCLDDVNFDMSPEHSAAECLNIRLSVTLAILSILRFLQM